MSGTREPNELLQQVLRSTPRLQELVPDAVKVSEGWATFARASRPPMTILRSLDGVEASQRLSVKQTRAHSLCH